MIQLSHDLLLIRTESFLTKLYVKIIIWRINKELRRYQCLIDQLDWLHRVIGLIDKLHKKIREEVAFSLLWLIYEDYKERDNLHRINPDLIAPQLLERVDPVLLPDLLHRLIVEAVKRDNAQRVGYLSIFSKKYDVEIQLKTILEVIHWWEKEKSINQDLLMILKNFPRSLSTSTELGQIVITKDEYYTNLPITDLFPFFVASTMLGENRVPRIMVGSIAAKLKKELNQMSDGEIAVDVELLCWFISKNSSKSFDELENRYDLTISLIKAKRWVEAEKLIKSIKDDKARVKHALQYLKSRYYMMSYEDADQLRILVKKCDRFLDGT